METRVHFHAWLRKTSPPSVTYVTYIVKRLYLNHHYSKSHIMRLHDDEGFSGLCNGLVETSMFRSLKILMISSDEEAISLVASILESEGHSLSSVDDLQFAIATLKKEQSHDGILFDTSRQPPNSQYLLKDLLTDGPDP
jgi:hypothetical protein